MDAHESGGPSFAEYDGSLTELWGNLGGSATTRQLLEGQLWVVVLLALVADVALTWIGIRHGIPEGNPAMRIAIGAGGIGALVLVKVAVLGIAGLVRYRYPRHGPVIAVGLALPWAVAAALNAVTLS